MKLPDLKTFLKYIDTECNILIKPLSNHWSICFKKLPRELYGHGQRTF